MTTPAKLDMEDYARGGADLGCDPNVLRAFAQVEAAGAGFDVNGLPKILFERHKFFRFTDGKYFSDHPDICNPKPGGYSPNNTSEMARLNEAVSLDRDAALKSASWGMFQIMGFNYEACGYKSVQDFVNAMYQSEGAQLDAVVGFIKSNVALHDAVTNKDWRQIARLYNGPNYSANKYDTKMAAAYASF